MYTHASLFFKSGVSIKEVQEQLGHKDVKTTMNIYTHVIYEKLEELENDLQNMPISSKWYLLLNHTTKKEPKHC